MLNKHELQQLMTVGEVAALLKVSRSRVFALLAAGEIRSLKLGASRRIRPEWVEDYLADLETEQPR